MFIKKELDDNDVPYQSDNGGTVPDEASARFMEQRACIQSCLDVGRSATETYKILQAEFGDDALSRSRVFYWYARFRDGRVKSIPQPRKTLSEKKLSSLKEQRECIKSCLELGKSGTETVKTLQCEFAESALSRSRIFQWYSHFRNLREPDDDPQPRLLDAPHQDEVDTSRVVRRIKANGRLAIRDVCEEVGISYSLCHMIVTKHMGLRRVAMRYVPDAITEDLKLERVRYCKDLVEQSSNDPQFMSGIITVDESLFDGYETENVKFRIEKMTMLRSKMKMMLITFFDVEGVVYYEFVSHGETTTPGFYLSVLQRLLDDIKLKRPWKWEHRSLILHHDNTPNHTSISVRQLMAKHGVAVLDSPSHSPDLMPGDFFLFPKIKASLVGHLTTDDIVTTIVNTEEALQGISKLDFKRCFESWQEQWRKCIEAKGNYIDRSQSK